MQRSGHGRALLALAEEFARERKTVTICILLSVQTLLSFTKNAAFSTILVTRSTLIMFRWKSA